MTNPIIGQGDAFTRHAPQYQQGYAQPNPYQQGYGQPQGFGQPGYGQPGQFQQAPQQPMPMGAVMTLDDVIAKTAITLGLVAVSAMLSFMFVPLQLALPVLIVSALVGLVTVFMVASRPRVPVGGVLLYAVFEGLFVGLFSKFFETRFPGIVATAVFATFVAAAATLFAYKFFNIRVTARFRKVVTIATAALAGVLLINFVLALFNINTGMREIGSGAGMLSIGISILAVALAVFNLVIDFDSVERGIAAQAPAQESWRAALGITVTMVWLYLEILRILSYFRD